MSTRETQGLVFKALASSARRTMMDIVRDHPGIPVGELATRFDVSRIAVMKHLSVLDEAGLVTSLKQGRVRRLYFNAVPIQQIYERWTDEYSGFFASRVTDLKTRAECRDKKEKQ